MQTFLPYPFFDHSASVLDKKRCWKQVVEAKQILCTLRTDGLPEDWVDSKCYKVQKWINHPAVQMWKGYEKWLVSYYNIFLQMCLTKHQIKTALPFIWGGIIDILPLNKDGRLTIKKEILFYNINSHTSKAKRDSNPEMSPWWLNDKNFHRAMRARLIEKDEKYYLPQFKEDKNFNNGKYLWPVNKTKTFKII